MRQSVMSVCFTYVCYVCFTLCVGLLCLFLLPMIFFFFFLKLLNVTNVGKGSPSWNQHFKYICIDSRFNPLHPISFADNLIVFLLNHHRYKVVVQSEMNRISKQRKEVFLQFT